MMSKEAFLSVEAAKIKAGLGLFKGEVHFCFLRVTKVRELTSLTGFNCVTLRLHWCLSVSALAQGWNMKHIYSGESTLNDSFRFPLY